MKLPCGLRLRACVSHNSLLQSCSPPEPACLSLPARPPPHPPDRSNQSWSNSTRELTGSLVISTCLINHLSSSSYLATQTCGAMPKQAFPSAFLEPGMLKQRWWFLISFPRAWNARKEVVVQSKRKRVFTPRHPAGGGPLHRFLHGPGWGPEGAVAPQLRGCVRVDHPRDVGARLQAQGREGGGGRPNTAGTLRVLAHSET